MAFPQIIHWKIDECAVYFDRMRLRGWCFHPGKSLTAVDVRFDRSGETFPLRSFGTSSPDIAGIFGPAAAAVRFDEWVSGSALLGTPFSLVFTYADGSLELGSDALTNAAQGDPYFQSWEGCPIAPRSSAPPVSPERSRKRTSNGPVPELSASARRTQPGS
jgi:hypothetical protein